MGIFFRIESVALLEDIPSGGTVEDGYHAASMYDTFLIDSFVLFIYFLCCQNVISVKH